MTQAPDRTESDIETELSQFEAIKQLMLDGRWRTVETIRFWLSQRGIMADSSGITARLRDFRKPKFGCYEMNVRRVGEGARTREYQVLPPKPAEQPVKKVQKTFI